MFCRSCSLSEKGLAQNVDREEKNEASLKGLAEWWKENTQRPGSPAACFIWSLHNTNKQFRLVLVRSWKQNYLPKRQRSASKLNRL